MNDRRNFIKLLAAAPRFATIARAVLPAPLLPRQEKLLPRMFTPVWVDKGGAVADGSNTAFDAQADRALQNLKSALESAGLTLQHVVYTQVYLDDRQNFAGMNRAYARYFPTAPCFTGNSGVWGTRGFA